MAGVVDKNGGRAQLTLNRLKKSFTGIESRQINFDTSNPTTELPQFGCNSCGVVLTDLRIRFPVVLTPVGEENIAAVFGNFAADRRADSGASADACH